MIELSKLNTDFIQSPESCVLSSYAVVNNYFTGLSIENHFEDYCRHYKIEFIDAKDAEKKYAVHFDKEWRSQNCKGYEIILHLHQNSDQKSFSIARGVFNAKFYLSTMDDLNEIKYILLNEESIINFTFQHSGGFHSVTAFDNNGLKLRDTTQSGIKPISGLESLGILKDSILYVKKQEELETGL